MEKIQQNKFKLVAPFIVIGLGSLTIACGDPALASETLASAELNTEEVIASDESAKGSISLNEPETENGVETIEDSTSDTTTNIQLPEENSTTELENQLVEESKPDEATEESTEESTEEPTEEITEDSTEVVEETNTNETTNNDVSKETLDSSKDTATISSGEPTREDDTANVVQSSDRVDKSNFTKAAASSSPVYRIYNRDNGEHFYTTNLSEKDWLVRIGWGVYEGIAFRSPTVGKSVYRLYNKGLRDHHYTMSWDEVTWLTRNYGWTFEGESWKSTDSNGKKVYRLFHPYMKTGSHHYTMNWDEVAWLTRSHGWKYEGVGFYSAGDSQGAVSYVLLNSPYINQNSSGYPMGCEAASLLQALKTKGYAKNYDLRSFIKEMPIANDNNPNNGFAGRPDRIQSGIYQSIFAKPLAKWANRYGKAEDIYGSSSDYLKEELRKGNPIVVYITLNFAAPQYGKYFWGTGIDNAHIVTLDGFNSNNNTYHISDPNGGKYWISASKFESSYNLKKSAVVIK